MTSRAADTCRTETAAEAPQINFQREISMHGMHGISPADPSMKTSRFVFQLRWINTAGEAGGGSYRMKYNQRT
jgi:hypothetical protein